MVSSVPEFPITVVVDGDYSVECEDQRHLETSVEFADDFREPYQATDRLGRRMRLVVADLAMLLAVVVEDDFDPDRLRIVELRRPDGSTELLETYENTAHRTLVVNPQRKVVDHAPKAWMQRIQSESGEGWEPSTMSPQDFHRLWERQALKR